MDVLRAQWVRRFGAAVVAAFAVAQPALSQDTPAPAQNGTQFRDWTLACRAVAINETSCVLNQVLVNAADQSFLAEFGVSLQPSADGPLAVLVMRVPTGVMLLARPAAEVDGDADNQISLQWQSCDERFCAASAILAAEDTAKLRAGQRAIVGYQPLGKAEPSVFQVSLLGITAGMNTLEDALE
ncbi:invasion associated locus B family protein [Pseudooceanicola sp. MF1-13]|uniref:invasion associated locus B family protein n=1 Tax=Pseudooceanicola sp. MF1-13 TaxID=3379095 RepID=UPI0038922128